MATISQQGGSTQSTLGQGQGSQAGLVDKLAQSAEQGAAKAIDRVKDTRDRAEQGIERQHQQITSRIRGLSDALRSSGESLGENEQVSALLNIASEQVDRVAQYVDNATPRSVARDIERFARERPAWFFGGAFLAGLALGRFAKSSREQHEDGLRFSEREYTSPARGTASSAFASGSSPYPSPGTQGSSYSGYTPSGSASIGGGYSTGSAPIGGGYSGGTTQRMGSAPPSTSNAGGSGTGYSNATSGSSYTGSGSSGFGGSSAGASYSGSSATGSAASPSSSQSTPPANTNQGIGSARNGNGGSSGASKS